MKVNNLSKKMKTANKGITLIALVVTIIVLLILVGVTVVTLTGENGILTQAKNAREETDKADAREQAKIDIMGWVTKELAEGRDGALNDATVKTILTGKTYVKELGASSFTTKSGYEITYAELYSLAPSTGGNEAVVGEIVTGKNKPYTNNGTAMIPVGFAIVPGLDDVSEGLVISDVADDSENTGNQFVWVPVSKENFATEFVRHDFSNENIPDDKFVSGAPTSGKYAEYVGDGKNIDTTASQTEQEAQKMYKSVKYNGGFYIGRYEVGKDSLENVVCKKGAEPYNSIKWGNSMTDETGGAVEAARNFADANNYESVTSTLVYGVQWDAVMRWISTDNELKDYLKDSSSVGNYKDSDDTNNPAKTGAVETYQLKNIYDMAGNVWEWTMESYYTNFRVNRGGSYGIGGGTYPVSYRGDVTPSYSRDYVGFRVALYLES